MTTTSLATTLGDYDVGVRHVHCHLRNSTPTSGDLILGTCEWQVRDETGAVVSGTKLRGWIPEFSYLLEDGWTIRGKYTDAAGNEGAWVSTGAIDVSGSYDATASPAANASAVEAAVATMRSTLTAGQVGLINIQGGTYDWSTASSAQALAAQNTTAMRIDFVWDGSSTKPLFDNCTGFATGIKGSFFVDGIDVSGTGSGFCFNLDRDTGGAGDRENYNVIVRNSAVDNFSRCIDFDDLTVTSSNRDVCRFAYFKDVSCPSIGQYHIYGYAYPEYWAFWDCDFGDFDGNGGACFRIGVLANCFFKGWNLSESASSAGNRLRILVGDGTGDARMHRVTWTDCDILLKDGGWSFEWNDGSGDFCVEDVAFNNVFLDERTVNTVSFEFQIGAWIDGAGSTIKRIRWNNCRFMDSGISLNTNGLSSNLPDDCYDDIWLTHCAQAVRNGTEYMVRMDLDSDKFTDDAVNLYGCAKRLNSASETFTSTLIRGESAAKVGTVEYCHLGRAASSGSFAILMQDDNTVLTSVSGTNSGTNSTDFNWTNVGGTSGSHDAGTFDPTLTADSGPLAGTGWPAGGYSIDANGYLRDASTPDAGPYEYGASTEPDDPSSGVTMVPSALSGITMTSPDGSMAPGVAITMVPGALSGITMTAPDASMGPGVPITMAPGPLAGITMSAPTGSLDAGDDGLPPAADYPDTAVFRTPRLNSKR